MNPLHSKEVRKIFLEFFESKGHKIVPSAPIVVKNDPTLMFTNAGMNQFKDYFLGNKQAVEKRVADTQKCLRVSGKHNDLEEVGIDTYHHTMFEMLGNWSFGDYFKKEAIEWAWELLTKIYKLDESRLYVSIFEGDVSENLEPDEESKSIWKSLVAEERIINGNKKDNFWEMGDTGPCGPCTEIHIDLRPEEERNVIPGKDLVNNNHPQVIEIWNNVFMQFNRKADGSLESLPDKHVDTGMGFERLVRAIQSKSSNYDTDIFMEIIQKMESDLGIQYGKLEETDIAFRVVADHIRTITFTISDGQLPASNGAGYVIRRILRRAVRYGSRYLGINEPYIYQLVDVLSNQFKEVFPEVSAQLDFIKKIIQEEEQSFLRTLNAGSKRFESYLISFEGQTIPGNFVFELYDTYGFPYDLTALMAKESNREIDENGFNEALLEQKKRSRHAAIKTEGDWVIIQDSKEKTLFTGYDKLTEDIQILRYRPIEEKGKSSFQLVFNKTCFYPEGGGQVGDIGFISTPNEKIKIIDTKKENDLILHISEELPEHLNATFFGEVETTKRKETENNHSGTHLLHAALRQVLGTHVAQKGSLVNEEILRFDFSHYSKMTQDEINKVEDLVNEKIREDILLNEQRSIPFQSAVEQGAMALFGEKYGETVRMITFDKNYSIELCGGTHVSSTGKLGLFKIISEQAIAAGVRRIEALTGKKAFDYIRENMDQLKSIKEMYKNPKDIVSAIELSNKEIKFLRDEIEKIKINIAKGLSRKYPEMIQEINGLKLLKLEIMVDDSEVAKMVVNELKMNLKEVILIIGHQFEGKANIFISIPDSIVKEKGIKAGDVIKQISPMIEGGGGGQPTFATAGGKNPSGISSALEKAKEIIFN